MTKLRVVIIGTGNVAGISVRALQGRGDVELVGVWGRSKNIGLDAGLLDTDTPCGIAAARQYRRDFRAEAGLRSDGAEHPKPDRGAAGERALVCQAIGTWRQRRHCERRWAAYYPPAHHDQAYVASLEAAAKKGNATFYMNGQEPGFVEHMALLAATLSNTIKRITSYELFNYSTVKVREEISLAYGFDEPPEKTAILELPGVTIVDLGQPYHQCRSKAWLRRRALRRILRKTSDRARPACRLGHPKQGRPPSPPSVSEPVRSWLAERRLSSST